VACWGENAAGETNIPAGLSEVAAISACGNYNLVLKSNGTVAAWGSYGADHHVSGLSNVAAADAGWYHWVALKPDGTFATWGAGGGSSNPATNPPAFSDVVAISAGVEYSVVLRSNGTVFAWGDNIHGQTNVPPGLSNVVVLQIIVDMVEDSRLSRCEKIVLEVLLRVAA
jgi:alpha-tubulin suppressor-like RCC1 family protein